MRFIYNGKLPFLHLKTFLREQGISGTTYKKLKTNKAILVNDKNITGNILLADGDRVSLTLPVETNTLALEHEPIDVLYESSYLLAVEKPAGLLVHPTTEFFCSSLANRVAAYYERTGQQAGIHPVSRLDKNTSGVVLFAKNAFAHYVLSRQRMVKEYLALVWGCPAPLTGRIEAPIARKPGSIIERKVDFTYGVPAVTEYVVLKNYGEFSLVKFSLLTGRTHQIRVHSAYIGHPLIGDNLYGIPGPEGLHFLHSWHIGLQEPETCLQRDIYCPLPKMFLERIRTYEEGAK